MLRRFVGLGAVVATVLAVAAPQASAHPRPASYYVALGDSLAAGYQPDPTIGRDQGYVARVHRALGHGTKLQNFGCDGATTTTLLSGGGGCTYGTASSQLVAAERFLRRNRHQIRVVTIDIGGNDVNRCAAGGTIDQACTLTALGTLSTNLGQIVSRLRAAAPRARIVGMTYYNPYLAGWLRGPAGQAVVQQSLPLSVLLNQILTGVYTAGEVRVADVAAAFASTDLTTTAELPGVGTVPLAVARICTWTWMCVPGRTPDIHPTSSGYQVIADAYLAQIRGYPQAAVAGQ
jgi:lysophospholipase L1-like esterase